MLNPFNDIFIQNVKKAVITESKDSKGISRYRVEIEDFQGNRFPVTSYEASGYNSEISIEAKINNSIKNKTHFKYTISSHYLTMLMIFLVLTFYRLPKRLYYKLRYEDS
jgi:hypothetical protein